MTQQKRAILDALAELPDDAFPHMVMALRARLRSLTQIHGTTTTDFDRLAYVLDDFLLTNHE